MTTYRLTIATPSGKAYDGQATCLALRGAEGDLAILGGHVPFVTSILPCRVVVDIDDETQFFGRVDGGLLTVGVDGVTLLTSSFVKEEE